MIVLDNPSFHKKEEYLKRIEFDDKGDRKNFRPELVHIVKCEKEKFGVTFVPVKYPTAKAAGLKCD